MRIGLRIVFTVVFLGLPLAASASTLPPQPTMETCLAYNSVDLRNACYDKVCSFSTACARSLVTKATELKGPKVGMSVLQDLYSRGDRTVTSDGHDLAHQVGRAAARISNGGWEAFMECPDEFFLGCRHGFFEAMLGELGSSVEAASEVCKHAPSSEKSFCFHGMGHGIMMANANDVFGSVKICDQLPGSVAKRGCYQGVFMENFNASERGETRSGVLDPNDVLSPCTKVDPKYRIECYGQHSGYILKSLSGSLTTAIQACERAGKQVWVDSCIRHFGQNMTTYDYQMKFLGTFDEMKIPESSKVLCDRFPEEHRQMCYEGAVHNFMLYDHPEQAIHFCSLVEMRGCTAIILPYIQRPIYSSEEHVYICPLFPDTYDRFECNHPVLAPILYEFWWVMGTALIASAAILLFGWRYITTPYKSS